MKWKYKVVPLSKDFDAQESQLNMLGKEGWELVCVSGGMAYLQKFLYEEGETIRLVEQSERVACCAGVEGCSCMTSFAECAC